MYRFTTEQQQIDANVIPASLQLMQAPPPVQVGERKIVTLSAGANGGLVVESLPSYILDVATSCLIQPLEGDRVCVLIDEGKAIVTDILARQQANTVMMLNGRCSRLCITAPEIELQARKRLTLRSPNFSLLTRSSRWVAETLHQISQRLFVSSKYAHRQVEQTDLLLAKHIIQEAQQSLVINSEIGSLKSSAVLKIDGGQIHVG